MSAFDRDRHHRISLRWRGYDYTQAGMYFVTICTRDRALFFADEGVREIAERCWAEIPEHYPLIILDEWVVMPNHVHDLVAISESESQGKPGVLSNAPTAGQDAPAQGSADASQFPHVAPGRDTLGVVIRAYKAAVTGRCRREGYLGFGWQRSYHDRVVRNDCELANIRHYIAENPARWRQDEHHPERLQRLPPGTALP